MLNDHELSQVVRGLCATAEVLGQEIKPNTAAIMAEDLSRYPVEVIGRALSRLRSNSDGRLTLKAIVDVIEEGAGRLTANEAWARALGALDEADTIVWTDEIRAAWSVAKPIMDLGDKVGARMAFIPAYDRLVKEAREAGRLPTWTVSLGWDQQLRERALTQAVQTGLLPAPEAQRMLPPPEGPVDPEGQERIRGKLRELADSLRASSAERERQATERREEARRDFEARKAAVVRQAEELMERQQETPVGAS